MNFSAISEIHSDSGRGNVALQILLQESPFLRFLDANSAFELGATVFQWRPATGSSSAPARAIGDSFDRSDLSPSDYVSGSLAIHGDAVQMDRTYQRDADKGLGDIDVWFAGELKSRFISFAAAYEAKLFNGAGTSNNIKGLKAILNGTTALPGFTGVYRVDDAAPTGEDSLDVSDDAGMGLLVEAIVAGIKKVKDPRGIIMNRWLAGAFAIRAKKMGYLSSIADALGNTVDKVQGVPIVEVSTSTIGNDEPDGATTPVNNTTSIYILSPGEKKLSIVTNSGLEYYDYDNQPGVEKREEKFEIGGAWKIEDYESVLRIKKIKAA